MLQPLLRPTSAGVRQFPQADAHNRGYGPWRSTTICEPGFCSAAITFGAKNPQSACDTISCTVALPRTTAIGPERGTWRDLTIYPGFGVPGVAVIDRSLFCQPLDPLSYAYGCKSGVYDAGGALKNVFVTGAN